MKRAEKINSLDQSMKYKDRHKIKSKSITVETLTIRVRMTKETVELFSIPVPERQHEFLFEDHSKVRVLDNPLEDSLRKYVAWGRL